MQTLSKVVQLISEIEHCDDILAIDLSFVTMVQKREIHLRCGAFKDCFSVYERKRFDSSNDILSVTINGVKLFALENREPDGVKVFTLEKKEIDV